MKEIRNYNILHSLRDSIKNRNGANCFSIDLNRKIEDTKEKIRCAGMEFPKALIFSEKTEKKLPLWADLIILNFLLISSLPLIFKEALKIRRISKIKRINWKETFDYSFVKSSQNATFFQYYFKNQLDSQNIYTETLKPVPNSDFTAKKQFIKIYICNFKYHLRYKYDR